MTETRHAYSGTRAAILLSEALKRYTSQHAGGLRGLAAALGVKQSTVLSHMGNGRIGIPLDRAKELAVKLNMDVTAFCLAVLEQRAPEIYEALEDELHLRALASLPPQARRACDVVAAAPQLSEEHLDVIADVVADRRPAERWLKPAEVPVMSMIREYYPEGVGLSEIALLRAGIEAVLEAD